MGKRLEQTLAVLNGWLGDYLSKTDNALATSMTFRRAGEVVLPERAELERMYPEPRARVVVLVHGLMCNEASWLMPDGLDYGSLLERDYACHAFYLRYNTGLPIADNGAQLAALLEQLVAAYPTPIEELLLVGYSMGGLLIRSATHTASLAQQSWLKHVRKVVYVGTPHLGAPAERVGRLVTGVLQSIPNEYTRLIADLGNLRSAGVKDLGHADLRHEDRALERSLWNMRNADHPVPLLPELAHYLIAGSMFEDPRLALLFGDSIVPVVSATFEQKAADALIAPERVRVLPRLSHLALVHHPDVYAALRAIYEEAS